MQALLDSINWEATTAGIFLGCLALYLIANRKHAKKIGLANARLIAAAPDYWKPLMMYGANVILKMTITSALYPMN